MNTINMETLARSILMPNETKSEPDYKAMFYDLRHSMEVVDQLLSYGRTTEAEDWVAAAVKKYEEI